MGRNSATFRLTSNYDLDFRLLRLHLAWPWTLAAVDSGQPVSPVSGLLVPQAWSAASAGLHVFTYKLEFEAARASVLQGWAALPETPDWRKCPRAARVWRLLCGRAHVCPCRGRAKRAAVAAEE